MRRLNAETVLSGGWTSYLFVNAALRALATFAQSVLFSVHFHLHGQLFLPTFNSDAFTAIMSYELNLTMWSSDMLQLTNESWSGASPTAKETLPNEELSDHSIMYSHG